MCEYLLCIDAERIKCIQGEVCRVYPYSSGTVMAKTKFHQMQRTRTRFKKVWVYEHAWFLDGEALVCRLE
jgi:hypothetical protein